MAETREMSREDVERLAYIMGSPSSAAQRALDAASPHDRFLRIGNLIVVEHSEAGPPPEDALPQKDPVV